MLLLTLVPCCLWAGDAGAQGLDYGQYETLFGEPVTISATGKPERVSDTPVSMDLITAEDIRRSGARDIPTLLRRLAGLDVSHASTSISDVGIGGYIRPLTSRVMVLINGRQVYYDGFGVVFWPTLPVEMPEIRQIEVLKGAQSALYGFNAVDGVINIVTFDPISDPVNAVQTRFGNQARREVAAITTQPLGERAGVRITAAGDHAHDVGMVDKSAANVAYAKNPNRRSASLDAAVILPDDSKWRLEASHTDVTGRAIAYNAFLDARLVTDSVKGSYTADTAIGRMDGTVYYTLVDVPWGETQPVGSVHNYDSTLVGQLSDLFKIGPADSFRVGLEARRNAMTSSILRGGTIGGDLTAASLMWDRQWTPAISMVNAIRYDYFQLDRSGPGTVRDIYTNEDFNRSIQGISANSAVIDKLTENDSLRLSFGRGLKLPTLGNFGLLQHYVPQYSGRYFYENPNLAAAAVYDYRIGWDHRVAPLDATARLSVFHDVTTKYVGTANFLVNRTAAIVSSMVPGSVTNGVEFDLRHKTREGWIWGGNYTFDRLHEHFDQGLHDSLPEHKINLDVGYAWGEWDAELYGSYASATKGVIITPGLPPKTTVGRVKSRTILSPHVGWQAMDNIRLELAAENLWPYQDTLPQRMETSYYLTVTITY
ncbi:TonB-dependent receptor plug domain-containing protein [Telmatospirillum siberiense]|uniref:TonB-dependent receptor plug domain-containing protein n=1 Tax=Telmatospirillum siberiense TaxID=382514 RepID=UPI0013040451|nr:TonB-dependent receptor plug domain-containing protein [Telmatospirillum siberiense]